MIKSPIFLGLFIVCTRKHTEKTSDAIGPFITTFMDTNITESLTNIQIRRTFKRQLNLGRFLYVTHIHLILWMLLLSFYCWNLAYVEFEQICMWRHKSTVNWIVCPKSRTRQDSIGIAQWKCNGEKCLPLKYEWMYSLLDSNTIDGILIFHLRDLIHFTKYTVKLMRYHSTLFRIISVAKKNKYLMLSKKLQFHLQFYQMTNENNFNLF